MKEIAQGAKILGGQYLKGEYKKDGKHHFIKGEESSKFQRAVPESVEVLTPH